ncbi:hypothetical protein AYI69_g11165, partial [Smittium culicis]
MKPLSSLNSQIRQISDNSGTKSQHKEQLEIWADHFSALAVAPENQIIIDQNTIIPEPYTECYQIPTWEVITTALKSTPNKKSPGIDTIPSEFWKLVQDEEQPTSILAKLIHKLVLSAWNGGTISNKNNTSIVVPIPKKGDLTD